MDPERFDSLVQSLARPGSRRRVVGVLAAALTPLADAAAKARHDRDPEPAKCLAVGKRCRQPAGDERHGRGKGKGGKGKHHPPSCKKCCSRYGAAGANGKPRCSCKPDGDACDNPSQCCGGLCQNGTCTSCPNDLTACDGNCVNLQTDADHCGDCATQCGDGQRCVGGACVCDGTSCDGCCNGDQCVPFADQTKDRCGTDGAACQACAGHDTCGGGNPGTPGVCGCTSDCTDKQCGDDNGCGGTCPCAECQTCPEGGCPAPDGTPCGAPGSGLRCCNGACPPPPTCRGTNVCCDGQDACGGQCCGSAAFPVPACAPSQWICIQSIPGVKCSIDQDCRGFDPGDEVICSCGTCCAQSGSSCLRAGGCCSGVCNRPGSDPGVCV